MVKTRSNNEKISSKKNFTTNNWQVGTYVWGCMNKVYWPAVVVSHKDLNFKAAPSTKSWIFWFGDHRVSQIRNTDLRPFGSHFKRSYDGKCKTASASWRKGVAEAIREYGSPNTLTYSLEQLFKYAEEEFNYCTDNNKVSVPDFVLDKLHSIKNRNKDSNLNKDTKIGASNKIKEVLKLMMDGVGDIREICLACYSTNIIGDHPLFEGGICDDCKKKVKQTFFIIGDDNIKYFCAVCFCLGNMVVCSTKGCGLYVLQRVFCSICLDDLCFPKTRHNILRKDPWFCFICDPCSTSGLVRGRKDWRNRVEILFSNSSPVVNRPAVPSIKRPIRVLSLFDGIASGLTALIKLNISVECYYSCEIDHDAINVVKKNYPGGITFLGDVRNLTEEDIERILPIDLLIGGSPCNDLSLANPYRKGLYGSDGTGQLFFEFYRILTNFQMHNPRPFFWFYENVASMSIQSKVSISRFLQCEPQFIDSAWVSSQSRPRLFWGNLLTLQDQQFVDDGPNLQDYLQPGRKAVVEKVRTVTTRSNSLRQGAEMKPAVWNCSESEAVDIDIIELEEMFGFTRNYTKLGNLSNQHRQKLLGKAWSVQTICMLLRFLQEYYQLYE